MRRDCSQERCLCVVIVFCLCDPRAMWFPFVSSCQSFLCHFVKGVQVNLQSLHKVWKDLVSTVNHSCFNEEGREKMMKKDHEFHRVEHWLDEK